MLSINLKAQDEYQWRGEENPSPATFPKGRGWYPLYHQWRTYNAEKPIIVNTYNTGTGKTKAALLRLFNYIIIDEFHYYKPKQLTAFLFFMKLSQHNGYIDSSAKKRQICILTATPRPQVTEYLNGLGIPIEWIRPGEIDPVDVPSIQ